MLGWLFQGFFAVLLPYLYPTRVPVFSIGYSGLSQAMVLGMLCGLSDRRVYLLGRWVCLGAHPGLLRICVVDLESAWPASLKLDAGCPLYSNRAGLMVLSTLSLWAIGPIMAPGYARA